MKSENTAQRLKRIMRTRNLRQVDILRLCEPYCKEYGVKLNKNDLSQYVSGKVEPGQFKLTILSKALGMSEAWLMGWGDNNIDNFSDNGESDADSDLLQAQISTFGDAREYSEAEIAEIKSFLRFIKQKRNED